MQEHYSRMNDALLRLCDLLDHPDFEREITLARGFIDHAEYGIALETLIWMMVTYDRRPTFEEWEIIEECAGAMNLAATGGDDFRGRLDWLKETVSESS